MTIIECTELTDRQVDDLCDLWWDSAVPSYCFMSEANFLKTASFVPKALRNLDVVYIATDFQGRMGEYAGFLGLKNNYIEMIFVDPFAQGFGIGRSLVERAVAEYDAREVTVHVRNEATLNFFLHLGFEWVRSSEYDYSGAHYPLAHMVMPETYSGEIITRVIVEEGFCESCRKRRVEEAMSRCGAML